MCSTSHPLWFQLHFTFFSSSFILGIRGHYMEKWIPSSGRVYHGRIHTINRLVLSKSYVQQLDNRTTKIGE